jgi:hypothetical protein
MLYVQNKTNEKGSNEEYVTYRSNILIGMARKKYEISIWEMRKKRKKGLQSNFCYIHSKE